MRYARVRSCEDNRPELIEQPVDLLVSLVKTGVKVGDKDGSALVGALFRPGGLRRKSDCEGVTLLILDIDDGVTQPDEFLSLWRYQGLAYSSYSNQPDHPKFRVVVELSREVTIEEFYAVWDWASERSGTGVLDQRCRNPVALYYLPRVPDEDALEEAWVKRLTGDTLDVDEILKVRPVEEKQGKTYSGESTYEMASDVLDRLSPKRSDDYDFWFRAGMALKEAEDSPRMLELWVSWSKQSDRYKPGDCERKWGTFTTGRPDAISLGTLEAWAKQDGNPRAKTQGAAQAEEEKDESAAPNRMAEDILSKHRVARDTTGICYEHDGRTWEVLPEPVLERMSMDADTRFKTSRRRRSETVSFIKTRATVRRPIKWNQLPPTAIPAWNGVFDVLTGEHREHAPEDWLDKVPPHELHPEDGADCPVWLGCLERWFPEDEDKKTALQEFFGYVLMPHALFKRALVCYGESNTGKSVVDAVLLELVGPHNTSSIGVDGLADPKRVAPIKGKMLNVMSELTADALMADDGFKRLVSTGDPVTLDEKYERQELYFPTAKHAIFTNVLPRITDATTATYNRLLLVHFTQVIPEAEQDPDLLAKLRDEIEGIMRWSFIGARRLYGNRGQFTIPLSGRELVAEHRIEQNPAYSFLLEFYSQVTVDDDWYSTPEGGLATTEVFKEFMDGGYGRGFRGSVSKFTRLLKGAGCDVQRHKGRTTLIGWRKKL